ncbi:NAD(P)/FAD-dependent oxidoreductase [Granulosicoccus antarcticus]|uniref:Gamma-glutamylputrescine oxidoreductase n=1 Tax=Granulosicoccus antarcticus IMCC3135 TaxID=1192854 RepID=A0A2Z2NWH4_9GAMM|nr:FAD-binding oxidoreductase [Granulosicoccus antarcticus]ASJ71494.1 Gamma-glutamylputrescine oxidoreductase [Granulosicoccus antarcticus IMCC3135]
MKLLYANDRRGVHAPSWYQENCPLIERPALERHISTEVCVIGAGLTGLATALELAASGHRVVVLDAHRVGWGASGRNGGQLGSGFNKSPPELEPLVGKLGARALWQIAEEAKSHIHKLCQLHDIRTEYKPGIVYADHRQRHVKASHDYCKLMERDYNYHSLEPLSRKSIREHVDSADYHGGLIDHGAGHIHPLKLTTGLAKAAEKAGAIIHESSEVVRIEPPRAQSGQRVITATGSVDCEKVVIATNGYTDNLQPSLNKWSMPINNFIVVTEPLGERATDLLPHDNAVADSRFVVNYFRRVDGDRLLFGGGENYSYRFPASIETVVRRAMLGVFPQLKDAALDYAWGGTLAITRRRLPYLQLINSNTYAAGGYSGHGLSLAVMYGTAIAEHIDQRADRFDQLAALPAIAFPGGTRSRPALLALAMTGYSWLDRM